MAEVKLVNLKKIYPHAETKKKKKAKKTEENPEKKVNLQITEEGVLAVQGFDLEIAEVGVWKNIISPDKKIQQEAFEYCSHLTIYGKENSYAESFAYDNNISFVAE